MVARDSVENIWYLQKLIGKGSHQMMESLVDLTINYLLFLSQANLKVLGESKYKYNLIWLAVDHIR